MLFKGLFKRLPKDRRAPSRKEAPAVHPITTEQRMEGVEKEQLESDMVSKELAACRSSHFRHLDRITRWEVVNEITHLHHHHEFRR